MFIYILQHYYITLKMSIYIYYIIQNIYKKRLLYTYV